jgi:NDP-sugar pyrophosphorylase family protein
MDILILMAGKGSRFKDLHTDKPKPLVPLHGQPLVRWVVENLRFEKCQRYIFVCLEEHVEAFKLRDLFTSWEINFEIIIAPKVTEGAACSALLASQLLGDKELIIANSDQFVLFNKQAFLLKTRSLDGCILSMSASGSKWSYIKTNELDLVTEVKEKIEISNIGTVGVYYFRTGKLFISAAQEMILANERHNNEFYLAPCYNFLIKNGRQIGHYNVGKVGSEMFGLGTADDFIKFENDPRSLTIKKEIFG